MDRMLVMILDPVNILLIVGGAILGLVMGALPGLTVTMATVLIVSLTFGWPMTRALAVIMGAYSGAVTGGLVSAITLNIPGTAAAVATVFDGYPMARRGEAGRAIGLGMTQSLIGGILGGTALAIGAPLISSVALKLGAAEYCLLGVWGLTVVSSLGTGSIVKGLISAVLGLLIAAVGLDPITGEARLSFGMTYLKGGIGYIPALIGLFGMKEVLNNISAGNVQATRIRQNCGLIFPSLAELVRLFPLTIKSALLGVFIGALPGTGGDIAALLAYGNAKRSVKNPSRPFGTGAMEGLAAPEAANNAAVGGALIPLLTLAIPGDSVTAVMLGAFLLHGLQPGPLMMSQQPEMFYMVAAFYFIAQLCMFVLGVLGSPVLIRLLSIKGDVLMPAVTVLCVVGAYAIQSSISDVWVMMLFGLIGFGLDRIKVPVGPMVLGIILGPLVDTEFRKAYLLSKGQVLLSFVSRPGSIILLLMIAFTLLNQSRVFATLSGRLRARLKTERPV
ncbi:MAG: tripartite tricarboxylate transporter permease [Ignavibacteriales bacterium]